MYQYDASYAVEVQQAHPGRFAIVKPVDPDDPAVAMSSPTGRRTQGRSRPLMADETGEPGAPTRPGCLDRRSPLAAARHDFPGQGSCSRATWTPVLR